jgi:hypothetical protein
MLTQWKAAICHLERLEGAEQKIFPGSAYDVLGGGPHRT